MKKILKEFQAGVHTFTISQALTKQQFNTILNKMYSEGRVIHKEKGREFYTLLDKQMPGITVTLYPVRERRTYRVSIKVEPCQVLDSDDPAALYQYSWKSYAELRKRCDRYLDGLCIPGKLDAMPISRCDLTCNLVFRHQDYLDAYLRILKKSSLIPHYQAVQFKKQEKKAKDPMRANQHSYCVRCKQASFLCYDKIDQLKMIGRCPDGWADWAILRLEVQLKRKALKSVLGKRALEYNDALLKAACGQAAPVICSYLDRMLPCSGAHLRYEDAATVVQKIKKETRREQMLYLLRKMSDAATWDSAARKWKEFYTDVTDKQIKTLYGKFDKLGINPITLPNSSTIAQLPPIPHLVKAYG